MNKRGVRGQKEGERERERGKGGERERGKDGRRKEGGERQREGRGEREGSNAIMKVEGLCVHHIY